MEHVRVYGYLRASTIEQDATRAKGDLESFASERGLSIAAFFIENESGAKFQRPELFRLLEIAMPGDVLLIEQVDRLTRLNGKDWNQLRAIINQKQLRVVALDLPTSHQLMQTGDEFTGRMLDALNSMMLDMLAAISHKDYLDRRRRQAQGIASSKHKFKGKPANQSKHKQILGLLAAGGKSYREIAAIVGCSSSTVSRVANAGK